MSYKAEYIWIDGTTPTPNLRSKTKIIPSGESPPVWGFDGSSTNQASGDASDCVLNPQFVCPDPIRCGDHKLVLCEVLFPDGTSHWSNTRRECAHTAHHWQSHETIFGFEQEYTFMTINGTPLGLVDARTELREGRNKPLPQGPYYCAAGAGLAIGRDVVEEHLDACLAAGLKISGINAEVMPGQWEFQVGPVDAVTASDQLWVARWLLHRIAENHGVAVSFDPKPAAGDWNGAGCHTNVSTNEMRESYDACIKACESLGERHSLHIERYGHDIEDRLTGDHETCSYRNFRYGVSDRGASVRIPWQVHAEGKGYIEDRRPNSNCDPYVVSEILIETICSALD
ncbi:MAG TPA: glutamine synthetase [Pseudomonadales bacterium]|nr:glutamine synthetase [Pseudomonadales bacterium]